MFLGLVKTRRSRPALDPGSPAQASLPIEQLPRERSPTGLPDCAARGFAGPSTCPACLEPDPKTDFAAKTVRLSTALLGSTTLASRFAHHDPQGTAGTASRLRKIDSSGASYQLTPKRTRRSLLTACRRRSDLWSPAALSCRCRLFCEAGTAVPITTATCTPPPSRKSEKWVEKPVDNGDIGNNSRNLFRFAGIACLRLPFRSPPPTSTQCLNRLRSIPTRPTSRA